MPPNCCSNVRLNWWIDPLSVCIGNPTTLCEGITAANDTGVAETVSETEPGAEIALVRRGVYVPRHNIDVLRIEDTDRLERFLRYNHIAALGVPGILEAIVVAGRCKVIPPQSIIE